MSFSNIKFMYHTYGRDGNRTVRPYHNLIDKAIDEGRVSDSGSCREKDVDYRPNEQRPSNNREPGRRILN